MFPKLRNNLRDFLKRHEHSFSLVVFVLGFLFDFVTLKRIDALFDHVIVIVYLAVAALCITLFVACDGARIRGQLSAGIQTVVPFVLQFFLGGLFSVTFIFYSRSGTWGSSGVFLGLLAGILIGNEFVHSHYRRYVFQMCVFFVALFAYAIIALPIILSKMGALIFVASSIAALLVMAIFSAAHVALAGEPMRKRIKLLWLCLGVITVIFQVLYFTNTIPPVPLTLKEGGVYHSVSRTNEPGKFYSVTYEPRHWYELFQETSSTYHRDATEPVYVYSSVFAPTNLRITIAHRWSFYDEKQKKWLEKGRIVFPIVGGRDGGYRGYSMKSGVVPGDWRVDVVTDRDQVIGRIGFTIVETGDQTELTTDFR